MTRVATGGAQTIENCVATGGAQRHDAMKSNGTKGSPLAALELSQKSVQPYVYMYPMHECMYISDCSVLFCNVLILEWSWNGPGVVLFWSWNGLGMLQEWSWNGPGMNVWFCTVLCCSVCTILVLEWSWNGPGMVLELSWNVLFCNVRYVLFCIVLELEWSWNGPGMVLEWS